MNKNTNNKNDRYYRTSSFYTACFLYAKKQILVNVDKLTDPRRAQFVLLDSPELEILLHQYNYAKENTADVLVDARMFVTAIKQLKDKLYQEESV
jgi:hypothetical protein